MKIIELKELKEQISTRFYNHLIKGEVKEAKAVLEFSVKLFRELNKSIPAIIHKLEENSADQLNALWKKFEASFCEFRALAEKELDITEQIFKDDPEVWKELLSSTFKENIDNISALLNNIDSLLEIPISVEEPLPMFEYSPRYSTQKEKDNLYSRYANRINDMEYKIRFYLSKRITNKKGITQKIKTGRWKEFYHAYLPEPMGNHRIVYSWNGKIIRFEIIGTHKELGIY